MDARQENISHQIKLIEAYITLWQTRILSGAYKLDEIKDLEGNEFSDERKLQRAMSCLESQVNRLAEFVDAFMS